MHGGNIVYRKTVNKRNTTAKNFAVIKCHEISAAVLYHVSWSWHLLCYL